MIENDITKCRGEDCPLKSTCIRFISTSGMWQSYFTEVPYNEETESCDHYWKGKTELKSRSKEDDVSKKSNNRTESKTRHSKIKTNTKKSTKKTTKKVIKSARSK